MYNPLLNYRPKVVVVDRKTDCQLCGNEMNENQFNLYRGLEICSRCNKELKRK